MEFQKLGLIQPLFSTLQKKGYTDPTPVQEQSIPPMLAGKDILGCAQTGTGKTAAFALPVLQLITKRKMQDKRTLIRALILVPTRELAVQVSESFFSYGSQLRIKHAVVYGGVSQFPQVSKIRKGVDILIATPGRLLDLINQRHFNLSQIEHFVLDEADRMLDMGFLPDIKKVIALLPEKRQTVLFSATISKEIKKLTDSMLVNPIYIDITPESPTTDLVDQKIYYVKKDSKRFLLTHLLQDSDVTNAIVFTRTKYGADKVVKHLVKNGIKAEAIHGDKSQGARERSLRGFKKNALQVLVATDIASRGLDIAKLSHVINYEMPEQPETYVHRIGRTGRAGMPGKAVSFCANDEKPYLKSITKLINKKLDIVTAHPFAD